MSHPKLVAIIPAAGLSRRMGKPKLLLPWRGSTVIANLIGELRTVGILNMFVVIRAGDQALQAAVQSAGGTTVCPVIDPPDMRTSVEHGLRAAWGHAGDQTNFDGWLLIPADHPIVSASTIESLIVTWGPSQRQILIPTFHGKRGHPTLLSRDFASEVASIPPDCGLNWLIRNHGDCVREVPVLDPGVTMDLDTPEDYQRLLSSQDDLP